MNPNVTILIIDDEAPLRMNLRALLEDLGYQVEEASNGEAGLKRCAEVTPDLILLDVRMPGLDGFETCCRLKENAATAMVPVIFLSGVLEPQEKVKAFQVGGVDYVTKPYHFDEVEARVRTHLDLIQSHAALEQQNRTLLDLLQQTEVMNRKVIDMNERLRQSEALKGHFLSIMRNEINNPMNAILALSQEIEHDHVPPRRRSLVGSLIAAEASALDFQIRNLFFAAALEAGEAVPASTRVDAASVLRDVIDSLRYQARDKGVSVSLEPAEGIGMGFQTDAEMLRLVAANLLSNAIKFSPQGGPVRIRTRRSGPELTLVVEDEGPGFRPEDHAVLFDQFRQLGSGVSRVHQGQGLGLAVTRAIMDLLKGRVTAAARTGRGSVFTCVLPELAPPAETESVDGNLFFFGNPEEA